MLPQYIWKGIEDNQDVALQTFLYQYGTISFILVFFPEGAIKTFKSEFL